MKRPTLGEFKDLALLALPDGDSLDSITRSKLERVLEVAHARVHYSLVVTDDVLRQIELQDGSPGLGALRRLMDSDGVRVIRLGTDENKPTGLVHRNFVSIDVNSSPERYPAEALSATLNEIGVRERHTLCLCTGQNDTNISALTKFMDASEQVRNQLLPPFAANLPGVSTERTELILLVPLPKCDRTGAAADPVSVLSSFLVFANRISVSETNPRIVSGSICAELGSLRVIAEKNMNDSHTLLAKLNSGPTSGKLPLDPHSGAVAFSGAEWRAVCELKVSGVRDTLIRYFTEKLPNYWQEDRPCALRVLYTPTKVLLRGEAYYANMRNVSPLDRLDTILHELVSWCEITHQVTQEEVDGDLVLWRLSLGFADQLRNIALQLFSFVHTVEEIPVFAQVSASHLIGDGKSGAHGLLSAAINGYYGLLLGGVDDATLELERAQRIAKDCMPKLEAMVQSLRSALKDGDRQSIGPLVRRWREADNPGENARTAALAVASLSSCNYAVGIGWGGIELPLVYAYLASRARPREQVTTYIASWSHYRTPTKSVKWYCFPDHAMGAQPQSDVEIVVFDDNTLSGVTLEHIRDELVLMGCQKPHLFVTRFSGERRLAQMQMFDHGSVDPELMGQDIRGFLGETPFARSWSTKHKDYKSPIGVFSLARRRILECIHNNSTVELYDREGF